MLHSCIHMATVGVKRLSNWGFVPDRSTQNPTFSVGSWSGEWS